jgi:hypothetical protein
MPNANDLRPRRNMTQQEIDDLWKQGEYTGPQNTFPPTGVVDLLMEPVMALADEADLSKYLLPLAALGMIKTKATGAAAPGKRVPAVAAKAGDAVQATSALRRALTGKAVLAEAARDGKKLSFADFRRQNPEAGAGMFDLDNAEAAIPGRPMPERYSPPRGTPKRIVEAFRKPSVRKALREWAEKGAEEMPQSWYRTSPLYEVFQQEFGEQAPQKFEQYMQIIASTSPRNPVPSNIRTGSYYWHLAQNGKPVPAKPGSGYGSIAQKNHVKNVRKVLADGGLDPLKNPKPVSFYENLIGNEQALTADTHNFRAVGMAAKDPRFLAKNVQTDIELPDGTVGYENHKPAADFKAGRLSLREALARPAFWDTAPKATEYAAVEAAQQKIAAEMGVTPARFQETLWVGAGGITGLKSPPEPFLRTLAARIAYTAERMGVSAEEVLRKHVRGDIPLLSLGAGAAVGGSLALQGVPEEQPQY